MRSLRPLPSTRTTLRSSVEVVDVEPHQLAHPDPRGVEELEHGDVAKPDRAAVVGERGGRGRIRSAASSARSTGGRVRCALGEPQGGPGVGRGAAGAVQPGGEHPGRRRPPGQGGARQPERLLLGQPAAQGAEVEVGDVGVAEPGSVLEQPGDVAEVGPDRVRRQVTLGDQVALVVGEHRGLFPRRARHAGHSRRGLRLTGPARRSGSPAATPAAAGASRHPARSVSTRPSVSRRLRLLRISTRPNPAVVAIESTGAGWATGTASSTRCSRGEPVARSGAARAAG